MVSVCTFPANTRSRFEARGPAAARERAALSYMNSVAELLLLARATADRSDGGNIFRNIFRKRPSETTSETKRPSQTEEMTCRQIRQGRSPSDAAAAAQTPSPNSRDTIVGSISSVACKLKAARPKRLHTGRLQPCRPTQSIKM